MEISLIKMNRIDSPALEVLPEPKLVFRYNQRLILPQDGLSIFGPVDADLPSAPANIPYVAIGSDSGIAALNKFFISLQSAIVVDPEKHDLRLWPPYPGFNAAFNSQLDTVPAWSYRLNAEILSEASRDLDPNKRAFRVVDEYMKGINGAKKRDEDYSLAICIVPDEVWRNCRPESKVYDGIGERISKGGRMARRLGQIDAFSEFDPSTYQYSVDFRRQLKARSMEMELPIQIIRESTLRTNDVFEFGERRLTPLSDRAWNLSTSIYYKAGGKPWRAGYAREGVCYIGIAFRRTEEMSESRSACCAAQMFVDSGDGIVFMGETGPWYSPAEKQFHLNRKAAQNLLAGVIETYYALEGKPLKEIFLHARSTIDEDEFLGYSDACPTSATLTGIRVRGEVNGLKLFREETRPLVRGSFWALNDRLAYIWASGFKDRIGTYDGWETPNPLRIDVQHGDGDIRQIIADILGLTKLNYNACRLGESRPVTVGFSNSVGEILVSNPGVSTCRPNFKYYI